MVGLPFKDIATSDSFLLREVPAEDDAEARLTLKRLQEVAIHPIVPAEALAETPLTGAVVLKSFKEAIACGVESESGRAVLSLDGTETEEQLQVSAKGGRICAAADTPHFLTSLSPFVPGRVGVRD